MERVIQDYEGSMRPGAFQCCRDSATTVVTGFRMYLLEYPSGGKKATTGCGGACDSSCGPIVDLEYAGWYLDFLFAYTAAGGDKKQIFGVSVRNHIKAGGPPQIVEICSRAKPSTGTTLQEAIVAPKGVPIGFEYSYAPETQTFSRLTLVGNQCPF